MRSRPSRAESGQAAVEAAITLPLAVFLILGSLQLFLMFHARLMAEHAAYRSVRAGSLSQGSCTRMLHAAMGTVLPTFARTDSPANLAAAFRARINNRYSPGLDSGHNGDIVWVTRLSPVQGDILNQEYEAFDDPDVPKPRLEVRLTFWYPLRIPFANWVIARIALAYWGFQDFTTLNPLTPVQNARWTQASNPEMLANNVAAQFQARTGSPRGTYVFPIQTTYGMRMMTPARRAFFNSPECR